MMRMAIVFALLGAYCVYTGVRLLLTGKLTAREEEGLINYSQKGAKVYKLAYAAFTIAGGLIVAGLGVVRYLEEQHIVPQSIWYNIIALAVVVVLAVIFLLIRGKSRKMTDDES